MNKYLTRLILIVLISLNLIFLILSHIQENKYSFLILDQDTIWKYSNKDVKQINKSKIKKLSYEKVKIYSENVFDGYYDVNNNKIYNSYLEPIAFSSNTIINKGINKIQNYSYNITTDINKEDEKNIIDILESIGIQAEIQNLSSLKYQISENEILYSISPLESNIDDDSYSVVFINSNGVNNVIYNKSRNDNKDYRLSSLNRVIDMNNDGNLEIILLSDIAGSAGNECYSLYQFNSIKQKYESIIDCED